MASVTLEELRAELKTKISRLEEIDAEHVGERFPEETKEEWNRLNGEVEDLRESIEEQEARQERVQALSQNAENVERTVPQFPKPGSVSGEDIFELHSIRRDFNDPSIEGRELHDRARKAIDQARFRHTDQQRAQTHVEQLLQRVDTEDGQVARRILMTGSPRYKQAFGKYLMGQYLSTEESRALSLTGSAGGFAVPFELDPSIIPTSNLAVNPYRALARVEQITVDEWRGVSSAGVTVAYAAEATAASDNAPTLAQPTISTEKAQAFIPYSIEVGMDWGSLQAEMARLLQDGKDELEATKFTLGSGTNEPQGVITGATTVHTAADTDSLTVADWYGLEGALPPRFRARASLVMNRATAQLIRQLDTAGGANIWVQNLQMGLANNVPNGGSYGVSVLGYPAYESSAMATTPLTTGKLVAVLGDFNYYVIVDRIGMTVETIPHLFDVTNNRPTGQRGLYAYFRNGAGIVSPNAFRVLKLA